MKYYLGIDLHKRVSTWVLLDEERNIHMKKTVPCTEPESVRKAIGELQTPVCDTQVVLEPVCGWRWVSDLLEESGLHVTYANTLKTRLIAESKLKYDTVDATILADLLRADYLPQAYKAPKEIAALRTLVRERAYLVHIRTGFKNRLQGFVTYHGIHPVITNTLQKAGKEYLRESGNVYTTCMLDLISEFDARIRPLDRAIESFARKDATAQLLTTMPTVGPITATTVVAEVGDFARFRSPNHLASYAGLIPRERSSGNKIKHGRITKVGSKYLRTACIEASMRVREKDADLYAFYERIKARTSPMKARVALGRKMLTIMWYMVKNDTPYSLSTSSTKRDDLVRLSSV